MMAENLKTTKYKNGTSIPLVTDNSTWAGLSTPAYCWYNNDRSTYGHIYGALYNRYTVETGNLCPTGWHVPSDAEWTTLTYYLGGESWAGGKLKSTGTIEGGNGLWRSPNLGATNETGFTALPGGGRDIGGSFSLVGSDGLWWGAAQGSTRREWSRSLDYNFSNVYRYYGIDRNYGLSVRCLRD
ncbi:MAG: hypothetical protein HC905_14715 [Bacteroidales bacterium]|nr:hypothetical protein [Bacteroidales bacterium]